MLQHLTSIFAACLLSVAACGCSDSTKPETPSKPVTAIRLTQSAAGDTTVSVDVVMENADVAYCKIAASDAAAPSLAEMMKGERLTASGTVRFDGLEAGSSYKVFGVAGLAGIYTDIKSVVATTSGERDDRYPAYVEAWQTSADRRSLMSETALGRVSDAAASTAEIRINPSARYQSMEGFGPAITGSAAYNLLKMSAADRDRILRAAFDPETGLGYNYVRISIGCSDFSLDEYTCCDLEGLEFFEIHEYDRRDLFPVLKEILAINPDVKIIATPWTCPLWMKAPVGGSGKYDKWTGGRVAPEHYADYAQYFVLWIQEMEANGFRIEAVTPQNEPLHTGNSASTYMSWEQQREFVKRYLGPAFREAGITTKIWAYDHNFDVPEYVTNIFADKEAAQYFDGSAWHAYGGSYTVLAKVHSAAPDKHIYFTEQSIGTWCPDFGNNLMWHISDVCLGTVNNYCRAVILWNFMLDDRKGPNRPGGCQTCYGFVDCDGTYSYSSLTYRSHWYAIGHMSKVVRRGAVRIGSTAPDLVCSAFENPDGSYSAVVLNESNAAKTYIVRSDKGDFTVVLGARSVTSIIWK